MTTIQRVLILSLVFTFSSCSSETIHSADVTTATKAAPEEYGELLSKYAKADGVRYAAWHANKEDLAKLDEVVSFYATTRPPADRDTALAWHLNAYNSWILHNILKKYPTKGPLDGETFFFHGKRIVISGEKSSFDHLEQKVIRPKFREPRIHFALNCASESCPPLHTAPFTAATLDADLNQLTRNFLNNNPQGVVVEDNKIRLSKIFDWYKEDFGGKEKLITHINGYRHKNVPSALPVEYMEYSWRLNQAG